MNLIKAAELLKGAPDSELARYLQNPTGEFPEYLVASEKLRREEMRQRFSQAQPSKTSIIDELLQKDTQQLRQKMQPQQMPQQMPPQAMGLGSVPPPEGMQLTPAPMMEAAQQQPQQFYDGGAVSFAEGGLSGLSNQIHDYLQGYAQGGMVDEIHDYLEGYAAGGEVKHFKAGNAVTDPFALPEWVTNQQTVPDAMSQQQAVDFAKGQLGESAVAGYEPFIQQQQSILEKNKKNYLSDFLIRAGLGASMSKGNLLQAAAEGALQGFDYHQKSKAADEQARRQLEESKFKFKAAQRAENAGLLGLSNQIYKSSQDDRLNAINSNRMAAALGIQAAQGAALAKHYAKQGEIDLAQVAATAENNRLVNDLRRDTLQAGVEDRAEQRRQNIFNLKTKVLEQRNKFENDVVNNPMSPYNQKVKELEKTFSGEKNRFALERNKNQLLESYKKSYGLSELESALADYQK
jgi:hypothetical protein